MSTRKNLVPHLLTRTSALAASITTFVGCLAVSPDARATSAATSTASSTTCTPLSDAEVFQAVFFGKGAGASRLPKAYNDARAAFVQTEKNVSPATRIRALERQRDKLVAEGKNADAKLVETALRYYKRTDAGTLNKRGSETTNQAFLRAFEARYPGELAAFGTKMRSGDPVAVRAAMRSAAEKAMNVALIFGHGPSASGEPYPEEDSNIAVVGLTFIVLFVLVFVAFPLTSGADNSALREDEVAALMAKGFKC